MITAIKRFIMGLVIGSSMLVPGVSGGCMAIILGVYDELIGAVSNIRKRFTRNVLLLINFLLGGLVGMVLLADPLLRLVNWQKVPCMYFFMGAIIACIPPLFKRAVSGKHTVNSGFKLDGVQISPAVVVLKTEKIKITNVIAGIVGAAIGISLQYVPEEIITASDTMSVMTVIALIIAGFIIAVALILPGISGSYILLIFGLYDVTLTAIKDLNLPFLIPFIIGALIGTFGTAKIIDNLMKRHPQFIFLLIIGFMLGSLYQVFPGLPTGIYIPISIGTFALGFVVILFLGLFGDKNKEVVNDNNIELQTDADNDIEIIVEKNKLD